MSEAACKRIVYARAGLGDPDMARCEKCGSPGPLTCHHLVKRSHGGGWDPRNIVVLEGSGTTGCHGWAEAEPLAAQAAGWAYASTEEIGVRPIPHYFLGRVWLDAEGGYSFSPPPGAPPDGAGMLEELRAPLPWPPPRVYPPPP